MYSAYNPNYPFVRPFRGAPCPSNYHCQGAYLEGCFPHPLHLTELHNPLPWHFDLPQNFRVRNVTETWVLLIPDFQQLRKMIIIDLFNKEVCNMYKSLELLLANSSTKSAVCAGVFVLCLQPFPPIYIGVLPKRIEVFKNTKRFSSDLMSSPVMTHKRGKVLGTWNLAIYPSATRT